MTAVKPRRAPITGSLRCTRLLWSMVALPLVGWGLHHAELFVLPGLPRSETRVLAHQAGIGWFHVSLAWLTLHATATVGATCRAPLLARLFASSSSALAEFVGLLLLAGVAAGSTLALFSVDRNILLGAFVAHMPVLALLPGLSRALPTAGSLAGMILALVGHLVLSARVGPHDVAAATDLTSWQHWFADCLAVMAGLLVSFALTPGRPK